MKSHVFPIQSKLFNHTHNSRKKPKNIHAENEFSIFFLIPPASPSKLSMFFPYFFGGGLARPSAVPESGLLCDLLWADPGSDRLGWGDNERGVSVTFGEDA